MARQVNWSAAERVDLPDMASVGSFGEGENRRLTRLALVGSAGVTGVLRGFTVDPEGPPSARVIVVMDHTSSESTALGGEFLGATTEYGVLIGGRTTDDSLEGPAQLILDFSAQPVGTYFVEMRYAQTTGQNDARAFWDEGTLTEVVASVDTLILPSWQVQIVVAPTGGEWLVLGEVAWGGGVIAAVDITDRRNMLYELADLQTDAFNKASQSVGFDFDRTATRGAYAVTVPSPLHAIRALQRQVLDLKGQDDTGLWNWYARPPGVPGGPGTFAGAKQTKNLRSVDTVTFTVGMSDDYGDFSGVTGLQQCLSHIQERSDDLPRRIIILLKNRERQVAGNTAKFEIDTPISFTNKDLEIRGGSGGGLQTPVFGDGRGSAMISIDGIGAGLTALALFGRSSLTMSQVSFVQPTNLYIGQKAVFVDGPVNFDRVELTGPLTPQDDSAVLTCWLDESVIANSLIVGEVNLGDATSYLAFGGFNARAGKISNTLFANSLLRLRTVTDISALSAFNIAQVAASGATFTDCTFFGRMGGWVGHTPNEFGMVDARGAFHIAFNGCKFHHSGDEDGVVLGNLYSTVDALTAAVSKDISFDHCAFSSEAIAAHTYGGGVGGADGTGHHIKNRHESLLSSTDQTTGLTIGYCDFTGAVASPSLDNAAIALWSPRNVEIHHCRFTDYMDTGPGSLIYMVRVSTEGIGVALPVGVNIHHNYFGDWIGDPDYMMCVYVDGCRGLRVEDNLLVRWGRGIDDTIFLAIPLTATLVGRAMVLVNVTDFWVSRNTFRGWGFTGGATLADSRALVMSGFIVNGFVDENLFSTFSGAAIATVFLTVVANCQFDNNIFETGNIDTDFIGAIVLFGAFTDENQFNGNRWNYAGGAGGLVIKSGIHTGNGVFFTVIGNHLFRGAVQNTTLFGTPTPSAVGYSGGAPPSYDVNYVEIYL